MESIATVARGHEHADQFQLSGRTFVQYDFRDHDGELFSCVSPTVEIARGRRDRWLWTKKSGQRTS